MKLSTLLATVCLGLILAALGGVSGCNSKTPKGAMDGYTANYHWPADVPVTGGTYVAWMFKGKGMAYLVWLDWVPDHLPDGRIQNGLDDLGFHYERRAKAHDWAKGITIGKQTYDLADGPVFLISKKGQQPEVKQLKRDISQWADPQTLHDQASEDPEIAAFLANKGKQTAKE